MVEIFDKQSLPEIPFLLELAEELEGTLCVIAYAGHETNLDFIDGRQKYLEDKYSTYLPHLVSEVAYEINEAYHEFQHLLDSKPTPQEIQRKCERIIVDHLIGPEPSREYFGLFQEFYDKYPETLERH
jgi:hypothetical protein